MCSMFTLRMKTYHTVYGDLELVDKVMCLYTDGDFTQRATA